MIPNIRGSKEGTERMRRGSAAGAAKIRGGGRGVWDDHGGGDEGEERWIWRRVRWEMRRVGGG